MTKEYREFIAWFDSDEGQFAYPVKELIRCKDCKWYGCTNGFDGSKIVETRVCNSYIDALSPLAESRYYPSENDYCSRAERKEE